MTKTTASGAGERHQGAAFLSTALIACTFFVACSVEWGGGQISIEDPAPPPDTTQIVEELEPEQEPLPEGAHLFLVRLAGDGGAQLIPMGLLSDDPSAPLDASPISTEDPSFRARFDSVFFAPGRELDLLARGGRIGSLVLEGARTGTEACASVGSAQAIVPPGTQLPGWAFAVQPGMTPETPPRPIPPVEATSSMAVAGPVLAERLIGGDRAFLAQRMALTPVEITGDTLAGMTATYLIADSLAVGPPGDRGISLFFLARFEPTRGFIPEWQEVRRYNAAEDKEVFEYLDWIELATGRLDVVRRYDATSLRLAASLMPPEGERELVWTEPAGCESIAALGG